ncbi:helix-turn-helix domain-containing protein [Saccharopolyspora erythraea]|uniref:Helix-turn-helix domain-containing protein n=2 Tax=Saccharopolyspora erythraea TaxID=1836 RepID=A4F825_SACEN|nr:helix-turn-helix domain-containing protein [Saccharopolyspora erythraea]EQD86120.1 hypothetical protein N599_11225 [Saccharopolyspora erythraea D]QRK90805.1 hypothetical protein JQX30_04850 [Saccharopolyspora erythraea]CAM00200.1 hypothetical protein SACE_0861 [Saccharopolyspora erythraea NRRL 2338]
MSSADMPRYLTPREERELAEQLATDYTVHGASIRILMFDVGMSYGAVHLLLTEVAGIALRKRGGASDHALARREFDDLDAPHDLAAPFSWNFAKGARITELAQQHQLYPYTVWRLLLLTDVRRPRRLNRAPYGSRRRDRL